MMLLAPISTVAASLAVTGGRAGAGRSAGSSSAKCLRLLVAEAELEPATFGL
jgi:hypothetical protein